MSSTKPSTTPSAKTDDYAPKGWQIACGILMLGSSAGLTLYTKKTGSMLKQMEKVRKAESLRRGPSKFGPPTKEEWDKMRPRFDKDDFF